MDEQISLQNLRLTEQLPLRAKVEDGHILVDGFRFHEDGNVSVWNFKKKVKYIVHVPGERDIPCVNASHVAQALRSHGRRWSASDTYNYFDDKRAPAHRNRGRLQGATIEKL